MTRVRYHPEEYHLSVEGHAGAGAYGEDVVCAGISVLSFTLIQAAEEFNMHLYLNETDGSLDVRCYPDEEDEERCRFLFNVLADGFDMMAAKYPEYIKFTGGSYGNEER